MDNYVGPYRILRLINRGGQGSVYLGYDKRLHRRVAIKIYSMPPQREARRHLLHEARLVAGIQSPKVVQIHDVIESSGHLALVMEYVPGCDLEEFLGSVRPSLASVLTIGADIAGALAVARQQHIVHGDLKAGNVLITQNGRAKLTDFGISRRCAEPGPTRWAAGSLTALSPEQYLGQPLDERSDLFALGCLLYRMLGGAAPFVRGGQLDVRRLLSQPPQPLQEVVSGELLLPAPLVELIQDLLQKNPQDRPANTRRIRQVLRAVSRGIPLAASNSLMREARPLFRPESPDDIPPPVPADLGRDGRSRLAGGQRGIAGLRQWLAALSWPRRAVLAVVVAGLTAALLVAAQRGGETPVRFDEPVLAVSADMDLPGEISADWLVDEVKGVLEEELGAVHVVGQVGATPDTALISGGVRVEPTAPQEALSMGLRCTASLCVFAITRAHAGARFSQQGVVFPDMSLAQWRDIVRGATAALYR